MRHQTSANELKDYIPKYSTVFFFTLTVNLKLKLAHIRSCLIFLKFKLEHSWDFNLWTQWPMKATSNQQSFRKSLNHTNMKSVISLNNFLAQLIASIPWKLSTLKHVRDGSQCLEWGCSPGSLRVTFADIILLNKQSESSLVLGLCLSWCTFCAFYNDTPAKKKWSFITPLGQNYTHCQRWRTSEPNIANVSNGQFTGLSLDTPQHFPLSVEPMMQQATALKTVKTSRQTDENWKTKRPTKMPCTVFLSTGNSRLRKVVRHCNQTLLEPLQCDLCSLREF